MTCRISEAMYSVLLKKIQSINHIQSEAGLKPEL